MFKKIVLLFSLYLWVSANLLAQSKTLNPSFRPLISFEEIFKLASKQNKPIFFEAFLPTCSHCIAYDKTFRDPILKSFLANTFLAYQLDLSQKENVLFLRKNKVYVPSTPSFIIFSPEGKVMQIEPVGDEGNSVVGIKKSLSNAIDTEKNAQSLLGKYNHGDRNFDNMLSVALFTRFSMDTVKNMEVVNVIASSLPKDKYRDEISFLLMQRVMLDDDNPLFQYFINNLPQYKAKFDSMLVNQTAENILMSSLFCSRARNYSPAKITQIKNGLKLLGIPAAQIALRCIVLEVLIDLDHGSVGSAADKINSYYEGKLIPEKEKDFWCKQLKSKLTSVEPCPLK